MGLTTRNTLLLIAVLSVGLAAMGLTPWFRAGETPDFQLRFSATSSHALFGFGDGYALIALGLTCTVAALWLAFRRTLDSFGILALIAAAAMAAGTAYANISYTGNLCGPQWSGVHGGSAPTCVSSNGGDVFYSIGGGAVTEYPWIALGIALTILLLAAALPFIENHLYEDYEEPESEWGEAWA